VLAEALPTQIVIDVHGVGYQLLIPLSSFDRLPAVGNSVRVLTHLHVREDAMVLYGFYTSEERDLFRLLVQHVTGVGPKLGLAVLSGMSVSNFKSAAVAGDTVAISKISGVGKKTAERMVLELKDKVGVAAAWQAASDEKGPSPADSDANDAVLALISLGYKQVEAHKAVRAVLAKSSEAEGPDAILREALKILG